MEAKIFKLNKKGDMSARKLIFYILFSFTAPVIFLLILKFVHSDKAQISEIPSGLEEYAISQRFLNSRNCFAFQDIESKRLYSGILDLERFNQKIMDECYDGQDTGVKAYRLTLIYDGKTIQLKTKNWEGFLKHAKTINIPIHNGDKITTGKLLVEMQDAK